MFPHKLNQKGMAHHVVSWALFLVFGFLVFLSFRSVTSHAAEVNGEIKSGVPGYCLDVHDDHDVAGNIVDSWSCNGSSAQAWTIGVGTIKHGDNYCLDVSNNAAVNGAPIILSECNQSSGEIWLRDQLGFENPNSHLCLSLPNDHTGKQLVLDSCNSMTQPDVQWLSSDVPNCSAQNSEGLKVACYAEREWTTWQSGTPNHMSLLNSYTDGAAYEEWCADFVSYVYKEAGYPFTRGETNGWDENIASNIQNMGFSMHPAHGYNPQPGDVAYFDYAGGHVEIVVSGGSTPTFVYGNSATIDPTTGNGEMEANTILSKGSEGQVVYYLSPN